MGHFHSATIAALLATVVTFAGIAEPVLAAPSRQDAGPVALRSLERIEQAVSAGLIDEQLLEELRDNGEADGIVTYETDDILDRIERQFPGSERARKRIEEMRPAFAQQKQRVQAHLGRQAKLLEDFANLGNTLMRFTSQRALLKAARHPDIRAISANRRVPPLLAESLPLVRQPQVRRAGYRGANTYVAVLDTGVRHDLFPNYFPSGSVPVEWCAVPTGCWKSSPHGTHVASTVLAVAPRTKILSVNVFSPQTGTAPHDALYRAVNWIITEKAKGHNIVAMNLSLGIGHFLNECVPTAERPDIGFRSAYLAGVMPVVAAGNNAYRYWNGKEYVDTTTFQPGIAWPACIRYGMAVGAVTDAVSARNNACEASAARDMVTIFSQTASTLSLLAPGQCINAASGAMQGTSMAAPHVAGAVAVLASARPSATNSEIWQALTKSGPRIQEHRPGAPNITRRRLNLEAALSRILPPAVQAPEQRATPGRQVRSNGDVHTTVTWSASHPNGVAAYALLVRTNDGPWTQVQLSSPTTTRVAFWLTPGNTYRFSVAAQSKFGVWSNWRKGQSIAIRHIAENHKAIEYGGRWTRSAWKPALGGYMHLSSQRDAYGCIWFQAKSIAWVGSRASNRGKARVWLNDERLGTIDMYAEAARARTVAFSRNVDSSIVNKLCIQVMGTSGRPTIDIDGFVLFK